MTSAPTIREATPDDATPLAALARRTFSDTFGHLYDPADLEAHLKKFCEPENFIRSLEAGHTVLILELDGVAIGYAKVGHVRLPAKNPPKGAQEIYRVYLDKPYQGRGYGRMMMMHIMSLPRIQTAPAIYLGVWENNFKAQALYKLHGFEVVGRHQFMVGNHADIDLIMERRRR